MIDFFYKTLNNGSIECLVCPNRCKLKEGQKGACFIRQNTCGKINFNNLSKISSLAIDPIEKKPLYHFYPGSKVLSFGSLGCNLSCKFCQNFSISHPEKGEENNYQTLSAEKLVNFAKEKSCKSIAFTYNEPLITAEFVLIVAALAKKEGIKTVAVSAGYCEPILREAFFSQMNAANIDLKFFKDSSYKDISSGHLEPVLETLKYIKHQTSCHLEITNMIIPNINDSKEEISEMTKWIFSELGAGIPMHFSRFHPCFKMQDKEATPLHTLEKAREIALNNGLQYVYLGNLNEVKYSWTYCPKCKNLLIERNFYHTNIRGLQDSKCQKCGFTIEGIF